MKKMHLQIQIQGKGSGINISKKGNNPRLNWLLGGAAVAGGVFASATLGAANYVVKQIVQPENLNLVERYNFTPYEMDTDFEDVLFPTANGRMLTGWYLSHPEERRVVIVAHGHRGRKEDMLGISTFLWKAGFNVLLFDFRAHGVERVKGELMTLGHQELEDFQAAIAFVYNRFAEDGADAPVVGAFGGSLGASVALVATARDERIRAVWADSPFASRDEVIRANWEHTTHLPSQPVMNAVDLLFTIRTGRHLGDFSPLKEIERMAPRPIFLTHATRDSVIPVSHAYKLFEAAKEPKELWIEEGLDHCGIYFNNRQEYRRRAINFFEENLVERSQPQSESAA
jgi:fermentation-respiration switch protein FrsA (DUF1100 family)